jgi:hypothetical protein
MAVLISPHKVYCAHDRYALRNAIMSFRHTPFWLNPFFVFTTMLKSRVAVFVLTMTLLILGSSRAFAQTAAVTNPAPVYAVLSLIGDRLDIVASQPQTGSKLNQNLRQSVPISEAVFDNSAVNAAARAIMKLNSKAEVAALNSRSAVLFEKYRELFRPQDGVLTMPDAIKNAIAAQKATHFILITKYNDEAQLKYRDGYDGVGRLEGLGFYLDLFNRRPVIAPYVYIKLVLVDMSNQRVMNTRLIRASMALRERVPTVEGINSEQAWETLTSAEKVQVIDQLIRDEITQVTPELIQGK